ncbi:hypothetical protein CDO28_34340 (plasmid) [Sinorhizobium meliloti]|nr:hypothetical protein CDO28_34340 [Sinorhizobium meliloti]
MFDHLTAHSHQDFKISSILWKSRFSGYGSGACADWGDLGPVSVTIVKKRELKFAQSNAL